MVKARNRRFGDNSVQRSSEFVHLRLQGCLQLFLAAACCAFADIFKVFIVWIVWIWAFLLNFVSELK